MKIYYIGSFPPVYGGVTIKNKNLSEVLDEKMDMRKIDMNLVKRGKIKEIIRLIGALILGKQYIIGLACQKNRRIFTKYMYLFKKKAMKRSVLIIMGGLVNDVIEAGERNIKRINTYKKRNKYGI